MPPKISLTINCDTRTERNSQDGLLSGVVNLDFLTDNIFNKQKAFSDFDIETIVFIDEHNPVPDDVLKYLRQICNCVVVRKHTHEHAFNDWNYISALQLARGSIICHCDQDTSMFVKNSDYISELIAHLDNHKFISYPSMWSPKPIVDPTFGNRTWASTRFFLCKKETLKFDVLAKCIIEPEWAYATFGDSPRRCNWLEHFLCLTNSNSCYYPPVELDKGVIFSWGSYKKYTLRRLNELPYEDIIQFVKENPIQYPVDIHI